MQHSKLLRRDFLSMLPAMSLLPLSRNEAGNRPKFAIACSSYNWVTFYKREGKKWGANLEQNIAALTQTGLEAFEPNIVDKADASRYISALKKYNIAMPSIYVGSKLHEPDAIENSINRILDISDVAKTYGTKIVVTNPSPLKWDGGELKNDEQLKLQAQAMEQLGNELRKRGLQLAYHTHSPEFKAGAREFHHILLNTSPKNVSFCFDVHWVFRGSENAQVAVFDILKLYGNRVVELHIRQSVNGVWSETFSAHGDIDYERLVLELSAMKIHPHLVIEQCLEANSPNTMNAVEAHQRNLFTVRRTFEQLL